MMKQKIAKRLTDVEIEREAKKAGCLEDYEKHLAVLKMTLDDVTEESMEALAGFMFALSAIGNEAARRNGIK